MRIVPAEDETLSGPAPTRWSAARGADTMGKFGERCAPLIAPLSRWLGWDAVPPTPRFLYFGGDKAGRRSSSEPVHPLRHPLPGPCPTPQRRGRWGMPRGRGGYDRRQVGMPSRCLSPTHDRRNFARDQSRDRIGRCEMLQGLSAKGADAWPRGIPPPAGTPTWSPGAANRCHHAIPGL